MSDIQSDVEAGLEEMDFEMVDTGVLELPTSKPACFDLIGDTSIDIEALESELDSCGFVSMSPVMDTNDEGDFYCYVDIMTDHYKKIHVKVWNDSVSVFQKENKPDSYELSRILHAIEEAFNGEIQHISCD